MAWINTNMSLYCFISLYLPLSCYFWPNLLFLCVTQKGKEAIGSCIRFIQKLSEKNERVKSWLAKNKAVANEILEHHQKLIQAEKEKEREQNAASSSRSLIPAHFLVKHK